MTFITGPADAANNCTNIAAKGVVDFLKKNKREDAYVKFRTKLSVHIVETKTNFSLYYFSGAAYLPSPEQDVKGYIFSDLNKRIVAYVEEKSCKLVEVRDL